MENKIKHYSVTKFWSCFSLQISMYMLNEKIFVLLIPWQVKSETVYFVLTSVMSSCGAASMCLPEQ